MKVTVNVLLVIFLIFFTGAASQNSIYEIEKYYALGDDKSTTEEFKVKPGQQLKLNFKTGAGFSVSGWNKDIVKVEALIGGRDADDVIIEYEETANGLEISTDYKTKKKNRKTDVEFKIHTPEKFNVEFLTMGGSVKMKKLDGELTGKTMGGQLVLSELKGEIDLTTMGGNITLSDSDLDGELETMGGSISMNNVIGNVNVNTMGGNISQSNVKGRAGADELSISTMGGNIIVDDAPNGVKVKTMGGNIAVGVSKLFVVAETMGGDINISEIEGRVDAETMGGDVSVKMKKNISLDQDVNISSMGGEVQFTVPTDFDMTLDIEIRFEDEEDAEIKSDFKIERTVFEKNGDKFLKGTATIGSGKNKVKIRTVDSEVKIRKI